MHMRGEMSVSINEFLTYAGVFFGGLLMALAGYRKKPPPAAADPVVASVGLEFGNRLQMDELIAETKRVADAMDKAASSLAVLADQDRAEFKDALKDLLERIPDRR